MGRIVKRCLLVEFTMIFLGKLGHLVGVHELVPKPLKNAFLQDIPPDAEEVIAGPAIAGCRACKAPVLCTTSR